MTRCLRHELEPYFEITEDGPLLADWLAGVDHTPRRCVDFLVYINHKLQQDIGYNIRLAVGIQTCEETLELRKGSCRDTAWLLVQILRHIGLAARFVSGYLVQLTPDEKSLDGPSGTDHDFTDLHAWTEVYIPGAGWIGLDPTSGLFAGEGHIPLACTPDPVSAAPVTGSSEKCEVEFDFRNVVTRIHEDPRVTKPYTDEQWESIRKLGRRLDSDLRELGRPADDGRRTDVCLDRRHGRCAVEHRSTGRSQTRACRRFAETFAEHVRVGCVAALWRGQMVPGRTAAALGAGLFLADRRHPPVARRAADRRRNQAFPMSRSRTPSVSAKSCRASWALSRSSWSRHARTGFTTCGAKASSRPALTTLRFPGRRSIATTSVWLWHAAWTARSVTPCRCVGIGESTIGDREPGSSPAARCILMPGGSPMGLRLPLGQLPWAIEEFFEYDYIPPSVQPPQVGSSDFVERAEPPAADAPSETVRAYFKQFVEVPYTALCIEPRRGHLYVFMPRLENFDHYAALLAAIEDTAAELGIPVLIEGYEPPSAAQLDSLKVTPDPGVIEVNIHPADNWDDLEQNTVALYEQARLSRLATEKFMLDGRHTGTGGGNHVTLGAVDPQ